MSANSAKIETIAPTLNRVARRVASQCSLEADDLEQHGVLKLLERDSRDAEFFNRPDVELVTFAAWRMKNLAASTRLYDGYVGEEQYVTDEDGETIGDFEILAAPEPNPEDAVIARETWRAVATALSSLDERNQAIAEMLASGYHESEIAAHLGISRSAISQRKLRLAACIDAVM